MKTREELIKKLCEIAIHVGLSENTEPTIEGIVEELRLNDCDGCKSLAGELESLSFAAETPHPSPTAEKPMTAEEQLIKDFADWSIKYPRSRVYPMSSLHMDDELVALEKRAKEIMEKSKSVPDYRLLLEKYIKYVFEEEGTDCLVFISHGGLGDFTDEDWGILQEISKKVNG